MVVTDRRAPKVGYLSGPVDARKVYDAWVSGEHTELFGTSYLQHWYAELRRQGREGVVVTSHAGEAYEEQRGEFAILNRPKSKADGLRYHVAMSRWSYDRLREMEQRGATTVVLTEANQYRFTTLPFRRRGMRFVNSFHCAIRSIGHKRFSPHEALIHLSDHTHLRFGDPTMIIVDTIGDELRRVPGHTRREVLLLKPDYRRELFQDFALPPIASGNVNTVSVMFAGRVTKNKGVFDIVEMAELLQKRSGPKVVFHIHGKGPALDELVRRAGGSPAAANIEVHGFAEGRKLLDHYATSDIVVVPTRSSFEEGVAKSVVEGVLALRPVVTSRACPSIRMLSKACIEAEVDNPASYAEAIWRLATDPDLAREKVEAANRLREQFFDPPERYDRQLRKALALAETPAT